MSWSSYKSLSLDENNWGFRKTITTEVSDFINILEIVLKRCGKFLRHLNLTGTGDLNKHFGRLLEITTKECPNLQSIDVDKQSLSKAVLKVLHQIFNKFSKCDFNVLYYKGINDRKLENLLEKNKKLECLKLEWQVGQLNGDFLGGLSYDTIRELEFHEHPSFDEPLDTVFQGPLLEVSLNSVFQVSPHFLHHQII